jgi:4-amino-4-deoxy-L-arabinose transferase
VPYDPISAVVIAAAALLLIGGVRSDSTRGRVICVLAAAFIIRLDAAWQFSLYEWDERFHALVARNLMSAPFEPTLYRTPLIPYDYHDWMTTHVWLHKPPGALWMMAASMRLFGVNEIAMRLPSVALSTGTVLLTFLIGRRLFGDRVAILAAVFHAVNGFLVALASGRRVADHVDTALIFFVALGIWAVFVYRDTGKRSMLACAGVALGAALLSKSAPGLLIPAMAAVILVRRGSVAAAVRDTAAVCVIGAIVAAPWFVYTWRVFPREAAWAAELTLMHVTTVVHEHTSDVFRYVRELPRYFGELVFIPLIGTTVFALRRVRHEALECLAWIAITYVTFSLARTRLPGFVMIAAPALFLVQAYYWWELKDVLSGLHGRWRRGMLACLLVLLAVLPARYLLEPTGPFERRARHPPEFQELRTWAASLKEDTVVFNMPMAIEAMFYSPQTVYSAMPTPEQVRDLTARGFHVVIYDSK